MNDRVFTACIVAAAPVHTGNGDPGGATDLPLHRGHDGRYYIPGTHIAGRLREIATRLMPALGHTPCLALRDAESRNPCGCLVCDTFGNVNPETSDDSGSGAAKEGSGSPDRVRSRASRVWCYDAVVTPEQRRPSIVRDGVGIGRSRGAAAAEAGAKYDLEWIPEGTAFGLRIELQHGASEDHEAVLALALSEWAAGRGRVGGAAARGGGAFKLERLRWLRHELNAEQDLLAFLRAGSGLRENGDAGEDGSAWIGRRIAGLVEDRKHALPEGAVSHFVRMLVNLRFPDALLVADPAAGLVHGVDAVPVFWRSGWSGAVLPGSSVRGALRSQFERVARTIGAWEVSRAHPKGKRAGPFAAMCPACDPFQQQRGSALLACDRGGAAKETVLSGRDNRCAACRVFGSTLAGSRLWITDAPAATYSLRLRDFVSIDRFTGGARETALFNALPLYDAAFRVELLFWNPEPWELAGLVHAWNDLDRGLFTIGGGGSKGFGRGKIDGVEFSLGYIPPPLPAVQGLLHAGLAWSPSNGSSADSVFTLRQWTGSIGELAEATDRARWRKEFEEACASQQRREIDGGVDHAYFDTEVEDLYPIDPDLTQILGEASHG